jgi:hypothetical protein
MSHIIGERDILELMIGDAILCRLEAGIATLALTIEKTIIDRGYAGAVR